MVNVTNPVDGERNTDIGNVLPLSQDMVDAIALDVPINMHRAKWRVAQVFSTDFVYNQIDYAYNYTRLAYYYINLIFCLAVNCEWSKWIANRKCSKACGSGIQKFSRKKLKVEANGGKCSGKPIKLEKCKVKDCPGKIRVLRYQQVIIACILL